MLVSHFNLKQDEEEEKEEERFEATPEAVVEEEKVRSEERKLLKSEISVRLSLLGKTADGDGYTYLKADCSGMGLTEILAIKTFKHLQYVNFSSNQLTLERLQPVTELPFLLLLHADKNKLDSAALKRTKYLQVIIMNHNQLTTVENVYQSELCTLEVGYNKIEKIHFNDKMQNIKCLDFRHNLIREIPDLNFPNLDSLYLAGNKITSLVGIGKLSKLRVLHVRNNPIRLLNGFEPELKKLQYINLRNCKVGTMIQVKKLRVLPALEILVLKGCPIMGGTDQEGPEAATEEEDPEIRIEVLAALPRLKRLNKGVFSPDERREAKDLMMQWLEEGENNEEEVLEEQNPEQDSEQSIEEN